MSLEEAQVALEHPGTLVGQIVTLEPLSQEHHDGLVAAVRDGGIDKVWYSAVPAPETMAANIDQRLAMQEAGTMLPFTARRNDTGAIIGMTTFVNIDATVPRVEIGFTWNAASTHGTGTNPDSKLLLLQHAFEVWECPAVEFRTDFHNQQSREAIARLGAKQDGILRAHTRMPEHLRDTVVFSILREEWAAVRLGLESRIARHLSTH